jgi:hypothetical protein
MKNSNLVYLSEARAFKAFPQRVVDKNAFDKEIDRRGVRKNYVSCCVCDWDRGSIDFAHMTPHSEGGFYTFDNIVPLCPNHHRQLDHDGLNDIETEAVQAFLWNIMETISS